MMINTGLFKSFSMVFTTQAVAVDLSNGIHYVTLSPNTLIKRTHYFFFFFAFNFYHVKVPLVYSPPVSIAQMLFQIHFPFFFFLGFLKFFTLY